MAVPRTKSVEIDSELAARAERRARERGVELPQVVREALERELAGAEEPQPPFSLIGAFNSGRGDLSKLASEDIFEPEPFR